MNFRAVLVLPKMVGSAQTHKSMSFIWIVWSTLYVYLWPPVDDWSKITPALCSPFPLFVRNKQWDIGKKNRSKRAPIYFVYKRGKKIKLKNFTIEIPFWGWKWCMNLCVNIRDVVSGYLDNRILGYPSFFGYPLSRF